MRSILGLLLGCIAVFYILSRPSGETAVATPQAIPATKPAIAEGPPPPFIATTENEYLWKPEALPADWPKFTVVPGKTPLAAKSPDQSIAYALSIQQQWRDFKNKAKKTPPTTKDTGLAIDHLLSVSRSDARFPDAWAAFIEARKVDRAVSEYLVEVKERKKRGVNVGMTAEEILQSSWGKPQKVNETLTGRGKHEQWVYGGSSYLYLQDGVLTSIQTSR